jgi:hypothetical protein
MIAIVVARNHGAVLSGEQVRSRLRARGVAPIASKAAATRAQWAAKRAVTEGRTTG